MSHRAINLISPLYLAGLLFAFSASVAMAGPLDAPSNLAAATVSGSEIGITWIDNSSKEDGFEIERSTDGSNFSVIDTVGSNVEQYSDTGLSEGTTYYYRVQAYDVGKRNTSYSGYSNIDSDTTMSVPVAPSNLSVTAATTSYMVSMTWYDNSDNEDSFEVERSTDGVNFSFLGTTPYSYYYDYGVSNGTTYYYRVRAVNTIGNSSYSNVDSATVADLLPEAPTNISTSVSDDDVTVSWTDNSDDENSFVVYRSVNGVDYSVVASTSANTTSYDDLSLADDTYYYKVIAVNAWGANDLSEITAATAVVATVPTVPSDLNAYASSTWSNIYWTDNSDNEDYFEIERSTDGVNFSLLDTYAYTFYADYTVSAGNTYYYRVRAVNGAGNSGYTNVASVAF